MIDARKWQELTNEVDGTVGQFYLIAVPGLLTIAEVSEAILVLNEVGHPTKDEFLKIMTGRLRLAGPKPPVVSFVFGTVPDKSGDLAVMQCNLLEEPFETKVHVQTRQPREFSLLVVRKDRIELSNCER